MLAGRHRRDWEELGALDPLWAVATHPSRKFGRWADAHDEFFGSGEQVVAEVLEHARRIDRLPSFGAALDFGCGVGRLTRALARRFAWCQGLDVAASMVETARRLNADLTNCHFDVNPGPGLPHVGDASFDFVLSVIVLQHLPSTQLIGGTISELVRVLRPGGLLVFQVPTRVPLLARIQVPLRLYHLLRSLGLPEQVVYGRIGLAPMRMTAVSETDVARCVEQRGGRIVDVQPDDHAPAGFGSRTVYVVREASHA